MFNKSTLSNGIRVVTQSIPYVKSVTVGIWVGSGSRNESDMNQGVSHFIEHLLFKGTTTRTAKDIAEQVDEVGGQINAFTAKEFTCYYVKMLDTHLPLALNILADMILNPKFAVEDIDKEREVVMEEYNMYEDTPDEMIHDIFLDKVWAGHALGKNILGTRESIMSFNREIVLQYYHENYTPDNIVIAASGNLNHQTLLELAEVYFKDMTGKKAYQKIEQPHFYEVNQSVYKDTEQVHICLGTFSVPQNSPEIYAVHILNNILGGSVSSRLFQSIREERGLAYSVYSYQSNYSDTGLFSVYAGTRPANTSQVIELIMENINRLCTESITLKELNKSKEQLKGGLLLGLESTSGWMNRIGKLEITQRKFITPDEIVKKIDAVTLEDLNRICFKLFKQQPLSCITLGPLNEEIKIII